MKNLYSQTAFLLFFIITAANLLSPSLSDDPQTQGLIKQICSQTSDFSFCKFILERDLPSPKTNLAGLTRITTAASLSFATNTLSFIQKSEAAEKDPAVKQLYGICEISYNGIVLYMTTANNNAKRGNFRSMETLLQSCGRPLTDCQIAIVGTDVPEVMGKNRLMKVFLSMGLYEGTLL